VSADQRYQIERLPPRERPDKKPIPGLWVIRDTTTDELVETGDEVEVHSMRAGAEDWIRRNRYVTRGDSGRS